MNNESDFLNGSSSLILRNSPLRSKHHSTLHTLSFAHHAFPLFPFHSRANNTSLFRFKDETRSKNEENGIFTISINFVSLFTLSWTRLTSVSGLLSVRNTQQHGSHGHRCVPRVLHLLSVRERIHFIATPLPIFCDHFSILILSVPPWKYCPPCFSHYLVQSIIPTCNIV